MSAALLLVATCAAPAAADERPRFARAIGTDLRGLGGEEEGRSAALFFRVSYPAMTHLRWGIEAGAGWARSSGAGEGDALLYGAIITGAAFAVGPASAGAELAAGRRAAGSDAQAMLEPRLRAQLWVKPDVSLGARIGADVLQRAELSFGLYAGVHTW